MEGFRCSNAAISLLALHRYDEARRELERAIECKAPLGTAAEPWKTFNLLYKLERAVGNNIAAYQARQQTMATYLAYRSEGGQSTDWGGQVVAFVAQKLSIGEASSSSTALAELQVAPQTPEYRTLLLQALQQVIAGERNPAIADDPALYYMDAVELILLLEMLNNTPA